MGGLDRYPSANMGVLQTPHPGTRVPLLRAQSDHGHVLPPLPLWLAWKLCEPCLCPSPERGLTRDPLNFPHCSGSVPALPTFRKTASRGHTGTSAPFPHPSTQVRRRVTRQARGDSDTPLCPRVGNTMQYSLPLPSCTRASASQPGSHPGRWPRVWPGRPGWPGRMALWLLVILFR